MGGIGGERWREGGVLGDTGLGNEKKKGDLNKACDEDAGNILVHVVKLDTRFTIPSSNANDDQPVRSTCFTLILQPGYLQYDTPSYLYMLSPIQLLFPFPTRPVSSMPASQPYGGLAQSSMLPGRLS